VARRAPRYDQPGYDQPGYDQPGYDRGGYNRPGTDPRGYDRRGVDNDEDVTGSVPPRRVERGYQRDERPIYWGQSPDRSPEYDDRDARTRRPPPPSFFPGPRTNWD
jgi:hypothetical protein